MIVINSDEEMKQYVEGKYTPIDFEHVTLLLAYGEESYQNEPGDYVLFSSGDNTYTLEITIKYYELPALNHWRVGYLVEKMENAKYVIDLKRQSNPLIIKDGDFNVPDIEVTIFF